LGGCYVSSSAPFPLEAKVTIGLWLDDRTRIWADGIVISHHSGLGMGVKFVNISHKNREDVMNFLDQLPKSEENPLLRDDE
jgi:hypothetical protein